MPQVKVHNSESLKKMCVKYVVNNMDYWCNRKSPNEIDILRRDTPEEELSSFELLPLPVFKAIIALLQKNWGTTIECLKLFLTYHLDSLKLLDDYEGSKKNENILVSDVFK
uniref:Uncharacterized protein n=1 Tax=Daphnia galeata TaxID=27404 RepID=A0A8J2WIP4_9CRUS|nr:unnamed protein product [Daphnia galeata]